MRAEKSWKMMRLETRTTMMMKNKVEKEKDNDMLELRR
jgi:hypothetical protein